VTPFGQQPAQSAKRRRQPIVTDSRVMQADTILNDRLG
jgi:hypothetical protein